MKRRFLIIPALAAVALGAGATYAVATGHEELLDARRWIADTVLAGKSVSLRTLRLRKGMSQAQLAAAIGTQQPHVVRIERGQADPQLDTCRRLARALGVDLNTLDQALQAAVDAG
jgi:DNA-binding XRE family transcriptional regulator